MKWCGHGNVFQLWVTYIGEQLYNKQRCNLLYIHVDTIYLKVDVNMGIELDKVSRTDMVKTMFLPWSGRNIICWTHILKRLSWSYGSWIYSYLCNQCLSPLELWVRIPIKRGVIETTLCHKACQWTATDRWFSPVSSINKTDCHNIAEIWLKMTVSTINHNIKVDVQMCIE